MPGSFYIVCALPVVSNIWGGRCWAVFVRWEALGFVGACLAVVEVLHRFLLCERGRGTREPPNSAGKARRKSCSGIRSCVLPLQRGTCTAPQMYLTQREGTQQPDGGTKRRCQWSVCSLEPLAGSTCFLTPCWMQKCKAVPARFPPPSQRLKIPLSLALTLF